MGREPPQSPKRFPGIGDAAIRAYPVVRVDRLSQAVGTLLRLWGPWLELQTRIPDSSNEWLTRSRFR